MEGFHVVGGERLQGETRVEGAKNAVLPILAAALLPEGDTVLSDCPDIRDVHAMAGILKKLGCVCGWNNGEMRVCNAGLRHWEMPDELSKQIRSSIFLLGPILGRLRRATVTYPGGCEIGLRPIDLHLKGLKALGVRIREDGGVICCDGRDMRAGDVYFDYPSVGATENVMMAAALLSGITTIHNAAREPEIEDLQRFINRMGGRIEGAGSHVIRVEGVKKLRGVDYTPIPDRIAAGTFLCAGAVTGGSVLVRNARFNDLIPVCDKLREMGCAVTEEGGAIRLTAPERLRAFSLLQTQPHPGFPTDMQAQMLAISCVAEGTSVIVENVFENRLSHVADLTRMGADIRVSGHTAVVRGVNSLSGMRMTARDLRGGAALVLAALCAKGESVVERAELVDRGYAHLESALSRLGANIERISLREA
ncbi:MAG: UDP-N-acetylglucosamine 1-carboxyvinyltransferase [Clostridia bacterium]|nr:UDP-N-acetylglucosamine 1-carboxyvinyltransferase [Clostridia bacterium]